MRFLFYSHDGHGLGHTRRNLAVASALAEAAPESSVLIATGVDAVEQLGVPANADVLKLPGLRKDGDGNYNARRLDLSSSEIRRLRCRVLEAAVETFRPSVMLVDKHPLGIRGELRPALERLAENGGRAVLGLRDVLDEPVIVRREWLRDSVPEHILRHYDEVLIYGDQRVMDPWSDYGMPASVRSRTTFCGYVAHSRADAVPVSAPLRGSDRGRRRPLVLATAGGGEDGVAVLTAFIEASEGAPWDGTVVAGPLSGEATDLRRLATERGVRFRHSVSDLGRRFGEVGALVCLGGYNTLAEALREATPTVCVPRTDPRREQLLRARAFERLGLLRTVEPHGLTPSRLREEVGAALSTARDSLVERRDRSIDIDGAHQAAVRLLELGATDRDARNTLAAVA